jgi:hypothetical protein
VGLRTRTRGSARTFHISEPVVPGPGPVGDNRDWAEDRDVTPVQPRGILLIGNLAQLEVQSTAESSTRRETFERFRRSLWNPEVLTYDELLERARFLVSQAKPSVTSNDEDDGLPDWLG